MHDVTPRAVVLVEGTSDRNAVEALARRRGRDLDAEHIAVVPMGGYGNLPRFLEQHRGVRLAGLYDAGEEQHFLHSLKCGDRRELERAGFYACIRDLEDELTRAVGPEGMERVLDEEGDLRSFRTFQKQPAHRDRPLEEQLHSFMWNRKQRYAAVLVAALDLARSRARSNASSHTSRRVRDDRRQARHAPDRDRHLEGHRCASLDVRPRHIRSRDYPLVDTAKVRLLEDGRVTKIYRR